MEPSRRRRQEPGSVGGSELLGIEAASELEYVRRVREGLPPEAAGRLMKAAGLARAEMDALVPRRTRTRQMKRKRLTPEVSDRIARAADVYALAWEVFGDEERANRWMREPNLALEGEPPLGFLGTASGAALVEGLLVRIAHGVYS